MSSVPLALLWQTSEVVHPPGQIDFRSHVWEPGLLPHLTTETLMDEYPNQAVQTIPLHGVVRYTELPESRTTIVRYALLFHRASKPT